MCSKYVQAWNKLIIKFSASSWLILINKYIEMHVQQNIKIFVLCVLFLWIYVYRIWADTLYPNKTPLYKAENLGFKMWCILTRADSWLMANAVGDSELLWTENGHQRLRRAYWASYNENPVLWRIMDARRWCVFGLAWSGKGRHLKQVIALGLWFCRYWQTFWRKMQQAC